MAITRQFWVVAHRWAGLTIALFLTVAGFTGIFLAFMDELEGVMAPEMFHVSAPHPGAELLSPTELHARVITSHPGGIIDYMPLHFEEGHSVALGLEKLDPVTGEKIAWSPDWDQLFVDPYTGRALGTRRWGDISQGAKNLMPFLYRLHYSFAVGEYGVLAFGIAALIWTIDSFVGFYLTLPVSIRRKAGAAPAGVASWRRRWKPSWLVRWSSSRYKINFDLHRAGALWIWPMLLVFAWSSVAFNLSTVYTPVMRLFGAVDTRAELVPLAKPRLAPKLDFAAALKRGEQLAAQEMLRRNIALDDKAIKGDSLYHMAFAGVYAYRFTSASDFTNDGGWTGVAFDSDTGALRAVELPQGQNGANTFTNWIMALHMGQVWGLPYRIAVSLIGLLVTMLSVTGVIIWMKKRSGRVGRKMRLPQRQAMLQAAE
jgi:uncharacterized iron-regulated membrane protein